MTKKKKEKTAQNKGQWITYVVYMLLGAACGIFDLMYMDTAGQSEKGLFSEIIPLALMLIGIYAAMLIQLIIHEAGHLIFGLMTGYRFSSFRIANLMWVKLDGRIQCRKLHIAGTGGQCLMIPPDLKDGKMPVMLYNFGGAIINLATAVLCVGLSFLCSARSLGWTILMIFAVIGLAFALINGLPIKMGSVNNDGRNALELSHSEEATRAFWIQMKVNEQIAKGLRLKDMPDEWFKVPSDELMKNGIVATTGVLVCNRLMDQQRFDEADMLMKRLLAQQNGIIGLYYEDGSPKLTEHVAAVKGFSITVSKIGLLNDCLYILPENEVKTSDIGGTAVTFGYRSMPYGPYDPDTHEPSGYYDMYVAEFEYDGIEYEIVAEQMEAEEVVKVVSSIIYGEEIIVDK